MAIFPKKEAGVKVRNVERDSPFYVAGVRRGDRIVLINGERINDELDFLFFSAGDCLRVRVLRDGRPIIFMVERYEGDQTGVTIVEKPIRQCSNHCIFCFIDQMPRGLRHSLYIKDEDVRLSLLSGSYVTISAFREDDLEHIIRIGLSPLYVSVHTTDADLRRRMLGNPKAPSIMDQLTFLARHGTRFHTQIVVCPLYNDGKIVKGYEAKRR